MRTVSRVVFIKQQKLSNLPVNDPYSPKVPSWRHSIRFRGGLLVTRSQLKLDLLRGWIDIGGAQIPLYGFPKKKT